MQSNLVSKLNHAQSQVGNFVDGLAPAGHLADGQSPVGERHVPTLPAVRPPAGEPADGSAGRLHVGIIMDGNGRWATTRGLSRLRGHEAGVKAIQRVVRAAPGHGVGTLTLYAFSSDNWRRPPAEVAALMGLLKFYLANEVASLKRNRTASPPPCSAPNLPPPVAERCICELQWITPPASPFCTRLRRLPGWAN
jgi:hypothetical protein